MKNSSEEIVAKLSAEIRRRSSATPKPFLVAIDGRSGVGKSTVAESLCQDLGAAIVAGDDFYAGGITVWRKCAEELAEICIDRAKLLAVLRELKSNRVATFFPFDWETFDGRNSDSQKTVYPEPLIILEGVYSCHPDIRSLVDCAVLLKLDDAEREMRLLTREGRITEWERQWHAAEEWYFDNLARQEDFDKVVDAG